ncbi:MAG TPA: nitrile hydratase subunit beta [Candidatus Dormibacteraeota bacterium]
MRTIHDLGGMQGFGAVVVEADEPVFHEPWERRMFGLAGSAFGHWAPGEFRHAIERMDPGHYLTSSYYEHWLTAAEALAIEHRLLQEAELRARGGGSPTPVVPVSPAASPPAAVVIEGAPPRFGVGDRVEVTRVNPAGHTRCPGYVRGATGTVAAVRGEFSLDDAAAHGAPRSETVYLVRFAAAQLFGSAAEPHWIYIELWESHLEAPTG